MWNGLIGPYGLEIFLVTVFIAAGFFLWYRQIRTIETKDIPERIVALHQKIKASAKDSSDDFTKLALNVADHYGLPQTDKESLANIMTILAMQQDNALSKEDAEALFSNYFHKEKKYLHQALGAYIQNASQMPYVSRIVTALADFRKLSEEKDFGRVAYGQPATYSRQEAIELMESQGNHDPKVLSALKKALA